MSTHIQTRDSRQVVFGDTNPIHLLEGIAEYLKGKPHWNVEAYLEDMSMVFDTASQKYIATVYILDERE